MISFFCSLVAGFILKFPPTKNWRGILVIIEKSFAGWWRYGLGDDQSKINVPTIKLLENVNHVHGCLPPKASVFQLFHQSLGLYRSLQYYPPKRSIHF